MTKKNTGPLKRSSNNNKNERNNKKDSKKKKDHVKYNGISSHHKRGRNNKLEITFDPQARREYLTGASQRKKDRRIYGLAMQKLKDRQAKLERRREDTQARKEQVEEAERQKETLVYGDNNDDDENDDDDEVEATKKVTGTTNKNDDEGEEEVVKTTTTTFQDEQTTSHFGGNVIVTTTFGIPEDDEDADKAYAAKRSSQRNVDTEQKYSNNVQKYIQQVKGKLPAKKKKQQQNTYFANKKGKHGAQGMKGMGNTQDLKMAQKTLNKFREKNQKQERRGGGRGGGKRKRH